MGTPRSQTVVPGTPQHTSRGRCWHRGTALTAPRGPSRGPADRCLHRCPRKLRCRRPGQETLQGPDTGAAVRAECHQTRGEEDRRGWLPWGLDGVCVRRQEDPLPVAPLPRKLPRAGAGRLETARTPRVSLTPPDRPPLDSRVPHHSHVWPTDRRPGVRGLARATQNATLRATVLL